MKPKIREKLDALEVIFGMLNELITEQRKIFEASIKRQKCTYEFYMDCDNCGGGTIPMNIPFGITIDNFKASYDGICPDCGCSMKDKKGGKDK